MKTPKKEFTAKTIETFRKSTGVKTRSMFADILGISRQYYGMVVNAKYFPNFPMLFSLHKTGFDIRKLFGK